MPRLDNEPNPDLPGWTTVSRDLQAELDQLDVAGRAEAERRGERYFPNPIEPHSGALYQHTANLLDAAADRAAAGSTDPDDLAAERVRAQLQPFLRQGTAIDYRLERQGR